MNAQDFTSCLRIFWDNITLIHQHAKSITSQPLFLDLQAETWMPQLKPEFHLLNNEMDREAFQDTKSKLVLTQLAQVVTTAVM